ncbi:MAG: hypothetical protein IPL65_11105 [Lewinellaceae bacterium]|nr:hypothetical protein [Lewinellaceae bacterium]
MQSVLETAEKNGYIVSGYLQDDNTFLRKLFVLKTNPNLSIDKTYSYDDQTKDTHFMASAPVADGGFIFAGDRGSNNLLLVKSEHVLLTGL